jgi:hypothetical protein
MHAFRSAHNGIGRTGLDAQRTADALTFHHTSGGGGLFYTMLRIEGKDFALKQACEPPDTALAAGRTLVNVRKIVRDGLRIGAAARISAFRALRLRKQGINGIDRIHASNRPPLSLASCLEAAAHPLGGDLLLHGVLCQTLGKTGEVHLVQGLILVETGEYVASLTGLGIHVRLQTLRAYFLQHALHG